MKKRNYSLDFLKIIATFLILFHHYQQVTGAKFIHFINFWNGKFYFGYVVELFFIISGILMYDYIKKIQDNKINFDQFIKKRLARLVPTLLLGAIVFEIIAIIYGKLYGASWGGSIPSLWGTIINGLGIQHGWCFADPGINNPTWYCSVLLLMYIVFYFGVSYAKKHDIKPNKIFLVFIIIGCSVLTYKYNWPFLNPDTSRGLISFFTGLILADFLNNNKQIYKSTITSNIVIICSLLLYFFAHKYITNGFSYLLTFIFYPALIIYLNSPFFKKIFNNKYIAKLSDISFATFVIHCSLFPLMFVIFKIFNFTINFNKIYYMFIYSLICWLLGYIIHELYEKRIKLKLDKLIK